MLRCYYPDNYKGINSFLSIVRIMARYEMFYILQWFPKYTAKQIRQKLPKGYITQKTVYNYKSRMKKAERKARELTKNW